MSIDSKLIILEKVGFDIHSNHLNALEHVLSLKKFIVKNYPDIAALEGFEDSFKEYPYDLLGNIQAVSDLADKHLGYLMVAM